MQFLSLVPVLCFAFVLLKNVVPCHCQKNTTLSTTVLMQTFKVLPDVIDTLPPSDAQVTFPSGARMEMGTELTPSQVKSQPANITYPTEPNATYTLVFEDLDPFGLQNRTAGESLNWLVVNIPGTNLSAGETYTEYIGPGPSLGSGYHRYAVFLFKQPDEQMILSRPKVCNYSSQGRIGFVLRHFVAEYGLGSPVAGNFFIAQYDDWVPNIERQRSGITPPYDAELEYVTFIKCNLTLPTF